MIILYKENNNALNVKIFYNYYYQMNYSIGK